MSVLLQSVLSPVLSGLQLHACASNARICSTATNALPRGEYGLQQFALYLYTVCLQEPVLHLDVSIYTGFCAAPGVSVYKSFVLHLDASAYKSFVLHLCVSIYIYKIFLLHLDASA